MDILEKKVPEKYFLSDKQQENIVDRKITEQKNHFLIAVKSPTKRKYNLMCEGDSVNLSHPTSKTRRGRIARQKSSTLLTSMTQAVAIAEEDRKLRLRKLTPLECWRLQGFSDNQFELASDVNSDYQLYRQAGNSVSVPIIYELGKKLQGE